MGVVVPAPEKTNLREDLKIERIECVIVEPKNRDGGGVPLCVPKTLFALFS